MDSLLLSSKSESEQIKLKRYKNGVLVCLNSQKEFTGYNLKLPTLIPAVLEDAQKNIYHKRKLKGFKKKKNKNSLKKDDKFNPISKPYFNNAKIKDENLDTEKTKDLIESEKKSNYFSNSEKINLTKITNTEWIRNSRLYLNKDREPIIGIPPKELSLAQADDNYFRNFHEMKTVSLIKEHHHLSQLLPHRYTKKVPIYTSSAHYLFINPDYAEILNAEKNLKLINSNESKINEEDNLTKKKKKEEEKRLKLLLLQKMRNEKKNFEKQLELEHQLEIKKRNKQKELDELEKLKLLELKKKQKLAEEELNRKLQEELLKKKKEEESLKRKLLEEEIARRKKEEEEAARRKKEEEEAARKKNEEEELARKKEEEERLKNPLKLNENEINNNNHDKILPSKIGSLSDTAHLSILKKTEILGEFVEEDDTAVESSDSEDNKEDINGSETAGEGVINEEGLKNEIVDTESSQSKLLKKLKEREEEKRNALRSSATIKRSQQALDAQAKLDLMFQQQKEVRATRKKKNLKPSTTESVEDKLLQETLPDFLKDLAKDASILFDCRDQYRHMIQPIFHGEEDLEVEEITTNLSNFYEKSVGKIDKEKLEVMKQCFGIFGEKISVDEFCIISALGEKLTALDDHIKTNSFNDINFKELGKHIREYNELFLSNNSNEGAKSMKYDDFAVLLLSTGLEPKFVPNIAKMLNIENGQEINYLDFLSYIPFFLKLHKTIVNKPLKIAEEVEDSYLIQDDANDTFSVNADVLGFL
ncbi:hypothetical protein HDU92_004110 [Lobulomyces angularis]|nr:hypothetical protein HDU92_004110 [Lobulomyces angularis]